MSESKEKKKQVWLLAFILIILVLITTLIVINIIDRYRLDSSEAVDLVVDGECVSDIEHEEIDSNVVETIVEYHPGFEASDDKGIWKTDTDIEIFKVSYVNGNGEVTVKSNDGDKVIAPGTENTYTFKFKNTGDIALDYVLEVNASIEGTDLNIPFEGRIRRHDGKYIAGSNDAYVDVKGLDDVKDGYTLGQGRYIYYTLDWKWPFEDNDDYDTYLGNLANEKDLILKIELKTIATVSDGIGGGIIILDTSTGSNSDIWYMSCTILALMLGFLFTRKEEIE